MANRTVSVTGTASGTPGTNGATYVSLAAALSGESAAAPNLVADTCILTIECYASAAPDTALADTGTGYTTSASYYINIVVPTSERHDGKWNTSKYRMECSGGSANGGALKIQEAYTRVTGLQIKHSSTGNFQEVTCIYNSNGPTRISNCILWNAVANNSAILNGVYGPYGAATIWNTVAFRTGAGSTSTNVGYHAHQATMTLHNCTAYGYGTNFYGTASGPGVLKNCISQASATAGYNYTTSTGSDYNLSDRADAVGSTVYNSKTLTFTDTANGDFHLVASDTDAIDKGTADPGSGLFSDDIDGVTRSGTWDLGADEYVAAGSTFVPQIIMVL